MSDIDNFCINLFDEAKRFLEKSKDKNIDSKACQAYLHASLLLGFCALEAHINAVSEEFCESKTHTFSVLDKSILNEKSFELKEGEFVLSNHLKMYRPIERYEYLYFKFSETKIDKSVPWWSQLSQANDLRNKLTHPKNLLILNIKDVQKSLNAILEAINALYKKLYDSEYPKYSRKLQSSMEF